MKQGRIGEAKGTLRRVKPAVADGPRGVDSHLKAYERAQQMLSDLESEKMTKCGADRVEQSKLFDACLGSSAIWQPVFADENGNSGNIVINRKNSANDKSVLLNLNIDAQPFYSECLKRSRSGNEKENGDRKAEDLLADSKNFEDALMAAVLGGEGDVMKKKRVEKRLKVFQDITPSFNCSPKPRIFNR